MSNIFTKIKWVVALGLIFGIVYMTNQVDQKNFNNLKSSVESIYKDRLIVKGYIYDLSTLLERKKIATHLNDSIFFTNENLEVNQSIKELLDLFSNTQLIQNERKLLSDFEKDLNELVNLEKSFVEKWEGREEVVVQLDQLSDDLYNLSRIQIEEGKRQVTIAQKSVELSDLFAWIEMIILICIAVVIQIIILYVPKNK
jgi:hypothetical protein